MSQARDLADGTFDENTLVVDGTNNRVGIGTSTPSANLDVASTNATIHLTDTDDTTYGEIRNNGGTFTIASDEGADASNSSINFRVDATERMRITSSGNVGINTTAPEATLHIKDIDTTGPAVLIAGGSATEGDIVVPHDESMQIGHWNASTNTFIQRIRYNTIGDVVLGTSTATAATLVGSGSTADGAARANNGYFVVARDNNPVFYTNRTGSDGEAIVCRKNGGDQLHLGTRTGAATGEFWIGNASNIGLRSEQSGADRIEPAYGSTGGTRDNAIDLGSTSVRFDDVYATNGTIQTSDEREKQQINALTTSEIAAATAISKLFKTYKWNDSVEEKGDAARTHAGVIAQQVEAAMTAEGLSAGDYAFFVETTWWETSTEIPATEATEERNAREASTYVETYDTAEAAPEGATERNRKGIRYPELLSFIQAATEQRLASIESRLDALEAN